MSKHTPGPWRVGSMASWDGYTGKPFRNVWAGEPDTESCVVVARCIDNDNCDEDARLIASAPDLLASLKRLIAVLTGPNDPANDEIEAAIRSGQLTIARADETEFGPDDPNFNKHI